LWLYFSKNCNFVTSMNTNVEVGWLDGFGTSKDYRCYALRCSADILYCARRLETLLHWECLFVNELQVAIDPVPLKGRLFATVIDKSKNAIVFLLPNKYRVAVPSGGPVDLFSSAEAEQGDYYLFSKKGKSRFKSGSVGYEYLLMVYADKGYEMKEVEDLLLSEGRLPVEDISDRIFQQSSSGKKTAVSIFLQMLFIALEMNYRDYNLAAVQQFLGAVRTIAMSNYRQEPLFQLDPEVSEEYLTRDEE